MQIAPVAHWLSIVQVVGQAPFAAPSQRNGLQEGFCPVLPEARSVQVPFAEAPAAAEQTSHPPLHALSQQTPSAQKPD